MRPGPRSAAGILAMRRVLRSPVSRIIARRLGVGLPAARLLTTLLFFGIAVLQRVRRVRAYLRGLARRR